MKKRYKGPLSQYKSRERRRIRQLICVRDKFICQICQDEVDMTLKDGNPMAPSLDHIVAHCEGGKDTVDNLRLAHAECNNRRHNPIKAINVSPNLRLG